MESFEKRFQEYKNSRNVDDLMTPSTCNAAYVCLPAGADLDDIEPFTAELTTIVDDMKEQLASETRILEGTEVPEYKENELSQPKLTEEQWKAHFESGCSTTARIHTSTPELSSSFSTAKPLSLDLAIADLNAISTLPSIAFRTLSDYGTETGAMSEFSECTVPTTSEPMPGTPSDLK